MWNLNVNAIGYAKNNLHKTKRKINNVNEN